MEKTRVEIRVAPAEWSAAGADAVEILISPNVGEELKPLEKIASGGELSRVALALKTCIAPARAEKHAIPRTLVFDEVDAGVGGSAAEAVGRRLKKLAGVGAGAVRDPPGADRRLRRASLLCREARRARPYRHHH